MMVRLLRVGLVAGVLAYAIVLRFDAISQQYDPVATPRWLSALQRSRDGPSGLRPASMRWTRWPRFPHRDGPPTQYRSDPYTYLQRARQMQGFYGAHLREPVFPFATKIALWLFSDQDVAVSVTSAAFSVLAVLGTFVLGAAAFSYGVGLGAAALLAVEYDVISLGTQGWRDDAFTAAVVWFCIALLAFVRHPSAGRAIVLGVVAAAACLVRITAISFLLPAWLWVLVSGGPQPRLRLQRLAFASAVAAALVAPYLVNCWRVFGDPLYAINAHAAVYQATEDPHRTAPASAAQYLSAHLLERPFAMLDTAAMGMTAYPFATKWVGFDPWGRHLGEALSWASLLGLALFTRSAPGRMLLVILAGSLIPYAFTWRLLSDWRFTEHAYPIFLIAACLAVATIARVARHPRRALSEVSRQDAVIIGTVIALGAVLAFALTRISPVLVFGEELNAGGSATIVAGDRDGAFFPKADWPTVVAAGTMTTRVTSRNRASVQLPLTGGRSYDAIVRIDPSPVPVPGPAVPEILILLNGRFLSTCHSESAPDRIGTCRFQIPADAVRQGTNRLTFASAQAPGFRVSYVRVQVSTT
jgi:hypothetical protein